MISMARESKPKVDGNMKKDETVEKPQKSQDKEQTTLFRGDDAEWTRLEGYRSLLLIITLPEHLLLLKVQY